MDGFGYNKDVKGNAIAESKTPNLDRIKRVSKHIDKC